MIRKLLPPLLFATAVFLAAEISYRLYAIGPAGLSPRAMNSMTTIVESGLVRPADNTDVWFELKPNLRTVYGGAPFYTNSAGLVDREYSLDKPPNTFRVAVIGSSWTMATGIAPEDSWHAILEARFNAAGRRIEFINFAVELYGIGEMAGVLKHKVMAYQPDLILAGMTMLTAYIKHDSDKAPFVTPPARHPFFEPLVLSTLADQVGIEIFHPYVRENLGSDANLWRAQFDEQMRAMRQTAGNTPFAIVWLGTIPLEGKLRPWVLNLTNELGMPVYEGSLPLIDVRKTAAWGETRFRPEYRVSRFNNHPNEIAHAVIADVVEQGLTRDKLIPAPSPGN